MYRQYAIESLSIEQVIWIVIIERNMYKNFSQRLSVACTDSESVQVAKTNFLFPNMWLSSYFSFLILLKLIDGQMLTMQNMPLWRSVVCICILISKHLPNKKFSHISYSSPILRMVWTIH